MIHKRPVYINVLRTFLLQRDLLIIVRSHNIKNLIISYIIIFLRHLFSFLIDLYIVISFIISFTTL